MVPVSPDSINELLQFSIGDCIRYEYPPLIPLGVLCAVFQGRYGDALILSH